MKKFPLLLLIFLCSSILWAEEVKIRKIKITGNTYTKEYVIKDFLVELKEGDRYELKDLEKLLTFLEQRILDSGYFYSVSLVAVDSPSEPGSVNIVAEVEEGFLFRFGGGPIYGVFGIENLGGMGKDITFVAGLNAQEILFTDNHPGLGTWFYSFALGNFPGGYIDATGTKVNQQEIGGNLETGFRLGYNWEIAAFHSQGYNYTPEYQFQNYDLSEGLRLRFHNTMGGFSPWSGASLSASGAVFQPEFFARETLDLRGYFSLVGQSLKTAVRAFGAAQQMTPLDRPEHRMVLSGLNGLRAPFNVRDLGFHKAVFSGELRWEVVNITLFDFVGFKIEPALVGDLGLIWNQETGEPLLRYDGGAAVRVFFGMPISVPLRFEYTWDNEAQGQFLFAVSAPF